MKRFFRNLSILLSISLIISEVVLRFLDTHSANVKFAVFPPYCKMIFKPAGGVMPGVSGNSIFSINSMGIRGDEFSVKQKYRILALGGSVTECLYLDDSQAWPYLLQTKLNSLRICNVWVGNVGASGKNSRDMIMHLNYLLPQYPRINVVIIVAGINDLILNLESGISRNPYCLYENASEPERIRHAFCVYPFIFTKGGLFFKNTALWKSARRIKNLFSPTAQDEAGKWYTYARKKRKNASEFLTKLPDLTLALEEYGKNINTIVNVAQKDSIRLIFVTQPSMWTSDLNQQEKDLCWCGWLKNSSKYYSLETLEQALQQYNNKLIEICKLRRVEVIDLANNLPKNTTIFYDDAHFNKNGSAVATDIIFKYLRQKEPFIQAEKPEI